MLLFRCLPIAVIITALYGLPTAVAHSSTTTVTITADGFSPREVALDTSSTVIFLNKDSLAHWPASNAHPRHDIYPEFDPSQAIAPGDFWAFKPTKSGTWRYHDHLNPHRQGTLIVATEADTTTATASPTPVVSEKQNGPFLTRAARAVSSFWHGITSVFGRLRPAKKSSHPSPEAFRQLPEQEQYDQLETIAKTSGVPAAWQYVKTVFTADHASLGGQAHNAAHFVGGLIYKKEGLAGLSVCDTTFAFGCYHGFTEGAFEKNLDALTTIANACQKLGPISSGPWSSCIHGIGHGMASYYNSTDLAPALATCDSLQAGATFCHDGVFMEFAISAPDSFYQNSNHLHPCDSLAETYQPACGRNILAAAGNRFNMPPLETAKACLAAEAPFTASCLDTFGFMAASLDRQDGARITARCQELQNGPATSQCAGAAAGELVFQNYPDWQTQAPRVCQALPSRDQASCFTRLNQTITNYQR
ncbi:MAG: hypothetical protein HYZ62_01305 [Candidatus Andersenbacteria bacterium]|nr:hypothetical protein [Candidatus Andersenbacteria bacterium]